MTIRKAKSKVEKRIKRKARIKKIVEYVVCWVLIVLLVAVTIYPVQYIATKYCVEKMKRENKTHVTILIGGEKITLEDVDVVHIEEE